MNYIFFTAILISFMFYLIKRLRKVSLILILLTFMAVIITYPGESIASSREGINLWLYIVIPSLLPFFIVNDMLIALKVPENIARLFEPAAKVLFNTSGYGAYAFIMSIFAGYPSGAKIVSQLIEDKKLTPLEGQKILTFSSTSGPLFIIGAVGTGMLGSAALGYILFFSHIIGSIANGVFSRLFFPYVPNLGFKQYKVLSKQSSEEDILSKAILNSIYTCGIIGGYIILFCVITKLIDKISFFGILVNLTNSIFSLPPAAVDIICTFAKSILEVSNGCKIISASAANLPLKLVLVSFVISFSGFSVIGQVSSVVGKGIRMKTYIVFKITQGLFSSLACWFLINIKLPVQVINNYAESSINAISYTFVSILILLISILILNVLGNIFKKRKSLY